MAQARNIVLKGRGEGLRVRELANGNLGFCRGSYANFSVDKSNVESYEVITEEKVQSASNAILRAGIASWIIGPAGLLAGVTAKQKGVYIVAIFFKDGYKSLVEIDDVLYKTLVSIMF